MPPGKCAAGFLDCFRDAVAAPGSINCHLIQAVASRNKIPAMKKSLCILIAAGLLTLPAFAQDFAPGRILVKAKSSAPEAEVQRRQKAVGGRESRRLAPLDVRVLEVRKGDEGRAIAELRKDPNIEFAEPDYVAQALVVPNDPYYAGSEWHLPKISAPSAWDFSTGASSVVLAVVDTGVQSSHPDLAGRVLAGYDFANNDSDPSDDNGHGTSVAGTAAAAGNDGIGVAGVAWKVSILPVKVLDAAGSGYYSSIANGITYAADRGARVINLSLGGTASSTTLQSAVNYALGKGCVIVAAAGNNGNSTTVYPAAYANVIAVSALNNADALTSWSSYGSFVDLCAPGENITTTAPGSGYSTVSGTSFSSPIVAGVAALALSVNPALTNTKVGSLLTSNADDLGVLGYDIYFGAGRVNAARVLAAALPVADAVAPTTAITKPADGTSIASARSVSVAVASSDNVAVTKAELYINGKLVASTSAGNFTYSWNTSKLAKGTYTLQSKAYDAAGNAGSSAVVSVVR